MPIEIDCPKCDNGKIYEETGVCHPVTGFAEVLTHQCPNCKDGKIKLYTQDELDKAVKAERRELLRLITEVIVLPPVPKKMLIEAIIARGK